MDDVRHGVVGTGPLPLVSNERDILRLALEVAARNGDPSPDLIEHTTGTREAATKTTGSWVRSHEPSHLIAIRGDFSAPSRPTPPTIRPTDAQDRVMTYPVQVLVVDVASSRVTDSGSSSEYPDLSSVGPVVADYPASAQAAAARAADAAWVESQSPTLTATDHTGGGVSPYWYDRPTSDGSGCRGSWGKMS
jgi:hypothetical protein